VNEQELFDYLAKNLTIDITGGYSKDVVLKLRRPGGERKNIAHSWSEKPVYDNGYEIIGSATIETYGDRDD
jgi:hypothetical protein